MAASQSNSRNTMVSAHSDNTAIQLAVYPPHTATNTSHRLLPLRPRPNLVLRRFPHHGKRSRQHPPDPWGANSASDISSCRSSSASSFKGSYTSATATKFPTSASGAVSGTAANFASTASTSASSGAASASSASNAKRRAGGPAWLKREL